MIRDIPEGDLRVCRSGSTDAAIADANYLKDAEPAFGYCRLDAQLVLLSNVLQTRLRIGVDALS
jgi:hypothetical protein